MAGADLSENNNYFFLTSLYRSAPQERRGGEKGKKQIESRGILVAPSGPCVRE